MRRTIARYASTAPTAGPAIRMAFCANGVFASVANEMPPRAASPGVAAADPPRPVPRNPDTRAWKNPFGEAGNAGITPPTSTAGARSARTANAPTIAATKQPTRTGWTDTKEAVR